LALIFFTFRLLIDPRFFVAACHHSQDVALGDVFASTDRIEKPPRDFGAVGCGRSSGITRLVRFDRHGVNLIIPSHGINSKHLTRQQKSRQQTPAASEAAFSDD
jgi:hypothetical protein